MMQLGRTGVWFSTNRLSPAQLVELAGRVEALGYGTLWHPESLGWESISLGAFLLANTTRLVIGSSIANIYARDAVTSRQALRTLGAFSGGRYVLGLGVSHVPLVEGARGHVYGKPVPTMRRYLETIHTDWQGPPPQVVIAALGPHMLALAGARSRGAIPYNVTPAHTREARAIMGPDAWLAVEQKVCLLDDRARARALARAELERYLTMPNYRNNWLRLGFSEAELAYGGSDRFLDAMVVSGSESEIKACLDAHRAAGANHVCIQPIHPDGEPTPHWRTLERLADC
jgi:probable F420-dependent oxidoreductase